MKNAGLSFTIGYITIHVSRRTESVEGMMHGSAWFRIIENNDKSNRRSERAHQTMSLVADDIACAFKMGPDSEKDLLHFMAAFFAQAA